MFEIDIPGYKKLQIKHLVLDYNGTIAIDGKLINGVSEILAEISQKVEIHILTADTYGKARAETKHLNINLEIIDKKNQIASKKEFIKSLKSENVAAIGNGMNDSLMLEEAALGIVVIQEEGASAQTLKSADVVCKDIFSAFNLIHQQNRLRATLRR